MKIAFKDLLEVTTRFNYLLCMREIGVKYKYRGPGRSNYKVEYIDSIPQLEFYENFLKQQIKAKPQQQQQQTKPKEDKEEDDDNSDETTIYLNEDEDEELSTTNKKQTGPLITPMM